MSPYYMSDGFGSGLTTSRYPGDAKSKGHFSYSIGVRDRHRLPIWIVVYTIDAATLVMITNCLSSTMMATTH